MEQLFVKQPVEHGSVPASCEFRGEELFQRAFDVDAARAFKQDGVARLGERAQHAAGFGRVVEKKRGAGPKACTHGCVQRATGSAAYSNEHIDPLLRGVSANVAMQRLSPAAEFEHLPQNRDPAPRRRVAQHVEHGAHRVRIGVVAIVINQNTLVMEDARRAFFRAEVSAPAPDRRSGSIP